MGCGGEMTPTQKPALTECPSDSFSYDGLGRLDAVFQLTPFTRLIATGILGWQSRPALGEVYY
jgi:hypothetical protein